MKQFACGDVVPGRGAVFVGVDDGAILEQVVVHAAHDHRLVEIPDELVDGVVVAVGPAPVGAA